MEKENRRNIFIPAIILGAFAILIFSSDLNVSGKGTGGEASENNGQVKIMTYNVYAMSLGPWGLFTEKEDLWERLAEIPDRIANEASPDIVALQEVWAGLSGEESIYDQLKRDFGKHGYIYVARAPGKTGLVVFSKFPLTYNVKKDTMYFGSKLAKGSDALAKKGAMRVVVDLSSISGPDIEIYNTHTQAVEFYERERYPFEITEEMEENEDYVETGYDYYETEIRDLQTKKLVNFIKRKSNATLEDNKTAIVALGDFNGGPHTNTYAYMASKQTSYAITPGYYLEFISTYQLINNTHDATYHRDNHYNRGDSADQHETYDYIFAKEMDGFKTIESKLYFNTCINREGLTTAQACKKGELSDHYAIMTTFEFPIQ